MFFYGICHSDSTDPMTQKATHINNKRDDLDGSHISDIKCGLLRKIGMSKGSLYCGVNFNIASTKSLAKEERAGTSKGNTKMPSAQIK